MVNSRQVVTLALLSLTLVSQAPAAQVAPLEQLLQHAEDNHSAYIAEKNTFFVNREAAPVARAELMPQAQASLTQGSQGNETADWNLGLSVSQQIYDLPRRRLWQAAQEQVKSDEANLAVSRQNLRRDVILAWLDVQLAAEVLRLVEKRRKTLQAQLERTEALAVSGQVIEADVLSARSARANADSQWQQAKHDLSVARDSVYFYTAAAAADMRLATDIQLPSLPPLTTWRQQMQQNNPALLAMRYQTASMRRRLQAAEAAVLPRLSISGGLSAKNSLGETSESWQLSLQQYLFTGGSLSAERRRLLAQSDATHAQTAAVLAQNERALKQLHGQMQADLARIDSLNESTQAAQAALEVIGIGYDNGVNIIAEVLSAEETVFDAQRNLNVVTYSYLKNLTAVQALLSATDEAFARRIEAFFIPIQ